MPKKCDRAAGAIRIAQSNAERAGVTQAIQAACQAVSAIEPPAAEKLRRLMNKAQFVQSHALSFFHLSAPDLVFGFDSDPATPMPPERPAATLAAPVAMSSWSASRR